MGIKELGKRAQGAAVALAAMAAAWTPVSAQELRCTVTVDASAVEGTSKEIFTDLEEKMADYMNSSRWSDRRPKSHERIECRLFLTVLSRSGDRIAADLQVQSMRPVFDSSYQTPMLNLKDKKIEFDYAVGDRLDHNDSSWDGNLSSVLDYYAWLILALDGDSFSPRGGQPYWDLLMGVVQSAQSSSYPGWKLFDSTQSRGSLFRGLTEAGAAKLRDASYHYHRRGLDEMAADPAKGRTALVESLRQVAVVWQQNPMSEAVTLWHDSKLDETAEVMSGAGTEERQKLFRLLEPMWGADGERLEKIKNL